LRSRECGKTREPVNVGTNRNIYVESTTKTLSAFYATTVGSGA
jgi:hypothetical protein